ncbi:MAG: plastocyanin/azurin family copper-binding protein [Acidimicrobiia bacterium]
MRNKPITALAALTLTVLLAACVPTTDTSSPPPPVSEGPTVTIQDMRFNSDHATIEEGDTVTWLWDDGGMSHDVSGDGFKSEIQSEGTFSHTFQDAGDYPYVCTLHSGMRGTVTVIDPA